MKIYLTKKKKEEEKERRIKNCLIKYVQILKNKFNEIIKFQNTRKLMDIQH